MKERPILMSAPMVRAILDGTKTQTRRVIKGAPSSAGCARWAQPQGDEWKGWAGALFFEGGAPESRGLADIRCPYGAPGDRLWVRETWADVHPLQAEGRYSQPGQAGIPGPPSVAYRTIYRADGETVPTAYGGCAEYPWRTLTPGGLPTMEEPVEWRPSIHMFRWASRLTLEITGVRVERVQDITPDDAYAEGISQVYPEHAVGAFRQLWDSINRDRGYGWDINPWVWVVEFRKARP